MTRKCYLLILLLSCFASAFAQNGKVQLTNDSIFAGYLKLYRSPKDGSSGIEFWETKKDKNPRKIPMASVNEYTLSDQTYKLFHHYQPFALEDIYFELVEAKLMSEGKVKLYRISNYKESLGGAAVAAAGGVIGTIIFQALSDENDMFILESKSGHIGALPSEKSKLRESLLNFFPERYVARYEQEKGPIKYGKVKDLVTLFNSK